MTGQADNRLRAKRFHPIGRSLELKKAEIEQTIPDRFEQIVRLHSSRLALKAGNRSLTYDELNRFANRIARVIMATHGPSRGPIALLFENGIDVVSAIFGVLKAGKFFLTIDPSWPANKMKFILDDAEARMIVTNNLGVNLVQRLKTESSSILNIDEISEGVCAENLGLRQLPEDFASILYTSGSTGEPKGIIDNHLVNMHLALLDDTTFQDRVSLLHSVAFGSGRSDVFQSLLNGAALFPFDLKTEGLHRLPRWLNEEQITVCHLPPLAFRKLAEYYSASEEPQYIRKLRLSGAPVTRVEFDLYKKIFPPSTSLQINMGTTETRRICGAIIDHNFQFSEEGVPVGYPAPWKKLLLLDDEGHEVGRGEMGEIAVKSRYLSIGYWRKPELTSAKFLRDSGGGDERIYLTGDLGRMLPDGFLIHLGRNDLMVKIRGYRVEVSEVEMTLLSHPAVSEVAVVPRQNELGESYLVAYFATHSQPGPSISELRGLLKNTLADYMVPSYFVQLDTIPLTSNGKVDRKALPVPGGSRPKLDSAYVAPGTSIEEQLVQIWQEVLGVRPIGIHDDFFDLGGHSLLGARLIAQMHQALKVDLPLRALFESPTIARLAAQVRTAQERSVPLEKRDWTYLWELQSGGDCKPVFLFPGGGGGEPEFFIYVRLARHVGPNYPIYGLRARGADGLAPPHRSVEEMAADYLKEIRTLQPEGPYYLVGECFGGVVAHEAAHQLQTQGQKVALLALLDTVRPTKRSYFSYRLSLAFQPIRYNYFIYHTLFRAKRLWKRSPHEWLPYAIGKARRAFASRSRWLTHDNPSKTHAEAVLQAVTNRQDLEHVHLIREIYRLRLREHKPKPYEGRLHLFVNEQWHRRNPELGWRKLVRGGLEVHKLPGNHTTYIRDHVEVAAEQLRKCLL